MRLVTNQSSHLFGRCYLPMEKVFIWRLPKTQETYKLAASDTLSSRQGPEGQWEVPFLLEPPIDK